MSNTTLHDALRGEPPPEWTRRPNAQDGLRAKARELRGQGLSYDQIAAALGVSKSSVSLWVRDLPVPERLSYAECRKRSAEGARRYWAAERPVREARRAAVRDAAAEQIGELEVSGAPPDRFRTPTMKRHNPKTVRQNVGQDYHGCLRIDVCRSTDLYRKIEGWAGASMAAALRRSESADTAAGSRPVSWNRGRGTTS